MTDAMQNRQPAATYLLRRAKSSMPVFRYKPGGMNSQTKLKRQPTVVLLVDENCPLHGENGKCSCPKQSGNQDSLGNADSSYQNSYVDEQQTYDNHSNGDDYVSTSIKPFNNNPPLPHTQKNVVGNNLQFNAASQSGNWNDANDEQLGSLMIYRDALKQNLTTPYKAGGSSLPKMRCGRAGGFWRHIKQTNTYSGSNLAFVDGTVRVDDTFKYPIPRYGYPPMAQPQQLYPTSSSQDFSYSPANPAAQSTDPLTWSATAQLARRPSLSQYSNRYERHAKEGFSYWPTDVEYKKPRYATAHVSGKPLTTGTYKTWLGLSDSILKL